MRDAALHVLVIVLGNSELHIKLALEILPTLDLRQLLEVLGFKFSSLLIREDHPSVFFPKTLKSWFPGT